MDVGYVLLREEINNEKEEPKGDKWTFLKTTFFFVVFYFFNNNFLYLSLFLHTKYFRRKYLQLISPSKKNVLFVVGQLFKKIVF